MPKLPILFPLTVHRGATRRSIYPKWRCWSALTTKRVFRTYIYYYYQHPHPDMSATPSQNGKKISTFEHHWKSSNLLPVWSTSIQYRSLFYHNHIIVKKHSKVIRINVNIRQWIKELKFTIIIRFVYNKTTFQAPRKWNYSKFMFTKRLIVSR